MIEAPHRAYDALTLEIPNRPTRLSRMRAVVDSLWEAFATQEDADRGFSWVGFYIGPGIRLDDVSAGKGEMALVVREPKPACSPIGLHGACGKCWETRRALVVTDVKNLGEAYVACDPRDRSEIVIPCLDAEGACFAVLDIDSFDPNAFSTEDALALTDVLERAGLTAPEFEGGPPLVY
jgi:putative methionine-R-sulfoxide reductase with GAF domain